MKTIKQAAKEFAEGEVMETYDSAIEALKRISKRCNGGGMVSWGLRAINFQN